MRTHDANVPAETRFFSWFGAVLYVPAIAALTAFAAWHLLRTGFWYDESMQFWISLGLDGFGPPRTPPGNFANVIEHNDRANLDPGGFGIALWLWLKLGTQEVWQRVLPLLFFAGGMACLGWLGWTLRRSIPFAALSSLIPAAYPLLLDYATEVRAYSMEFAGIAAGCTLLHRFTSRPSAASGGLAGIVLGAFLWSRYSFAIFTAAAVLLVSYEALRRRSARKIEPILQITAFVAPIAISAVLVFIFALWPHYTGRMSYNGGELLDYLGNATAAKKSWGHIAAMAAQNLVGPAGLPLTLAALIGLVSLAPRRWRLTVGDPALRSFGVLSFAALVLNALVWRWHPWDMSQKWSLWLHVLSAIAVVHFIGELLRRAPSPASSGWERHAKVSAFLLVGVLALDLRLATYRGSDDTLVPVLELLERSRPDPGSVAVDHHWYPSLRYFYEYGSFAGSRLYPASFRLPYHDGPTPLVSRETRFVITTLSLEQIRKRFPQVTITEDATRLKYLFRVQTAIVGNGNVR